MFQGNLQMYMKSHKGEIEVFLCPEDIPNTPAPMKPESQSVMPGKAICVSHSTIPQRKIQCTSFRNIPFGFKMTGSICWREKHLGDLIACSFILF